MFFTEKDELTLPIQEAKLYAFCRIPVGAKGMEWIGEQEGMPHLKLAFFGASTGAAALVAASEQKEQIAAVVSRGIAALTLGRARYGSD